MATTKKRRPLELKRTGLLLEPNHKRVLLRPFSSSNQKAAERRVQRVMALSEAETHSLLKLVFKDFEGRHQMLQDVLLNHFENLPRSLVGDSWTTLERKLLIASYFMQEYSMEAAALFNPSIVPHPDQAIRSSGTLKFVLSLRAVGEGHISSIVFRSGTIDEKQRITVDPSAPHVTLPRPIKNAFYEKPLFERKLQELGHLNERSRQMLSPLGATFTFEELKASVLPAVAENQVDPNFDPSARAILLLARSNYEVQFSPEQSLSERIIFPGSPTEINGMEDARFVQFHHEDGSMIYYATYTAYDGKCILPQLLETHDFLHFKLSTLNGPAVQNKGMALFPKKINGSYAMLARQDDENIFIMFSDHLHFWSSAQILLEPHFPWEFTKIGNCGSPIETDAGWLVLTHGVGAMRKYCIGAILLDLQNPTRVIGRLREPLIVPDEREREGYVPNVVYTCGAIAHQGTLVLPYAMSDSASTFATVSIDDLLAAME